MRQPPTWHAALAGLSASFVGIGLGRFAYTPLIPVLIADRWFAPDTVIYLGAANLVGYLAGAFLVPPLTALLAGPTALRLMMVVGSAAFFACATPVSTAWFFTWRFVAGLAGGVIMVLAAPTVLPHTEASRRGLVSGMIFTGVGLGVAASGTLVPLLLHQGLAATWLGLGVLSAVLTVVAWRGWPTMAAVSSPATGARTANPGRDVRPLLLAYGLNAVGLVPHMVFLVDFVARGLGHGVTTAALYWVVYGLAAMTGPLLTGAMADRIGFGPALRVAFLVQAIGVALPAAFTEPAWLALSAAIAGAFTPGIVPLALGRVHDLLPADPLAQRRAWGHATLAWALFQAGSAYACSWLFALTGGNYRLLFALGAAALILALTTDLVFAGQSAAAETPPRRASSA